MQKGKRPGMFGFRNPGRMRIAPELAVLGGNSDCRNRRLQTMFQLVGYGDHAGSGLPKIYKNWAGQHWRQPVLVEMAEPEQTLMELRMSSLLPPQAVAELESRLGGRFRALPETARLALITAQVEGQISHDRLKQISADHPADLTKLLGVLVRDGLLVSHGTGRGMVYHLPWRHGMAKPLFELDGLDMVPPQASALPPKLDLIPPKLDLIPPKLSSIPPKLSSIPPELSSIPPELPPHAASPAYLTWAEIPAELQDQLLATARPIRDARRASPHALQAVVRQLCAGRYLGRQALAQVLNRNAHDLFKRTLLPMVRSGQLVPAFAASRDPRQAYRASENPDHDTNP